MFDDQQQPGGSTTTGQTIPEQNTPLDMFAETDPQTLGSDQDSPLANVLSNEEVEKTGHTIFTPKILLGMLGVGIVAIVGILGFSVVSRTPLFAVQPVESPIVDVAPLPDSDQNQTPPDTEFQQDVSGQQEPILPDTQQQPLVDESARVEPAVVAEPIDTDGDGLSDVDEMRLGTNISVQDTDGDGLIDKDETAIYLTDPLKLDSDGDTYSDGTEVSKGYNPNGPGKLIQIPSGQPTQ